MSWQVFIALSVVSYSFSTILQKFFLSREKIDPMAFSIFFQIGTGFIIGAFALVNGKLVFPYMTSLAVNFLLMIVLYTLGNIFLFFALRKINASQFTVIFSSRVFFTILASTLFLHEGLIPIQFVGIMLIFVSVALVSFKNSRFSLGKYELFALGAAVSFGFGNSNDRIILKSFPLYPYVSLAFLLPAIATMVVFPKSLKKISSFFSSFLWVKIFLYCSVYAISALTFFTALQISNNSSQVSALSLMSVIITVILAIFLLGEKEHVARKIMGAVLSVAGVLLLS